MSEQRATRTSAAGTTGRTSTRSRSRPPPRSCARVRSTTGRARRARVRAGVRAQLRRGIRDRSGQRHGRAGSRPACPRHRAGRRGGGHPRSFIASASTVALRGARPVFAEVDPDSQNITPATVRAVLSPRTKAIIAVHLAGWPCEMDGLLALAREHDLADRGLRAGERRHLRSAAGRRPRSCRGLLVLPGQDHDDRRRRRPRPTSDEGSVAPVAWRTRNGKSYDAMHHRRHPPGLPPGNTIPGHQLAPDRGAGDRPPASCGACRNG